MKEFTPAIVWMDPAALLPYANNSKDHSEEQVAEVASSIAKNGWMAPICIDKDGVIVYGHCRWLAAKKLNLAKCPVIIADHLSEYEIMAYRIADNKLAERGTWNPEKLKIEIQTLEAAGMKVEMTGMTVAEAHAIVNPWESDHGYMEKIEPKNGIPRAKIVIRCDQDLYENVTETIKHALAEKELLAQVEIE